jgi:hypothetical protein
MGPSFKKNDPKIKSIVGKICSGREVECMGGEERGYWGE